jgi:hypothetical protein
MSERKVLTNLYALIQKGNGLISLHFAFETKHFFVTTAHHTILLSGSLNRIYGSVDLDAYEIFTDLEHWLRQGELTN